MTWLEEGGRGCRPGWGGGDKANLGSRRHIPVHFRSKFSAYGCRLTILRRGPLVCAYLDFLIQRDWVTRKIKILLICRDRPRPK